MTVEELCKMAQRNEPMPEGLCLSEQFLYGAVRNAYVAYRSGTITAEEGKNEKNYALMEYHKIRLWEEIFRNQHNKATELGLLMSKVNKEGCELCKTMAKVIDGRLTAYGQT